MPWLLLIVAGLLEVGWAIGLKHTEGFTRLIPSLLTVAGIAGSMFLLSVAAKSLPIGTAYGAWVGIGAVGTAVVGIAVLGEPASAARLAFLTLMAVSIVGLKATSGD
ncbi:DMT family transporter [Streptomyces sp. NPDC050658]|uniref:quaternary ammonium compound efflux SMR transporter SugE n=1 Tax=unclassified Streptomyces TaxID=2593676 RepID=UPI003438ED2D